MLKYFKNFIYNWIFNERWGRGSFLWGGKSDILSSFFSCFIFFLDMFFVSQHLCSISRQHEANFVLLSAICNKVYLKFSLSVLLRANLTTFHQNLLKDLYLSPWPSLKRSYGSSHQYCHGSIHRKHFSKVMDRSIGHIFVVSWNDP